MARPFAVLVSLALIGATLSPLAREPYDDGFPLSTYPMFATPRPTLQTYSYALGETAVGARRTLNPGLVGTNEVLQALSVIEHAVAIGDPELARLCAAIAARVAADGEYGNVVAIRIVTGTHDAVEYLARDRVGHEVESARCRVPR